MAGGQAGWDQLAEGMALRDAVSSTDAVSAIEQAESNKGNNGVPRVGGGNAGGSGQSSIKVVGDVTRAGYNLLNGRSVTDTSSIARSACGNRLTCQTWSSPGAAAAFANRVLGEREQRTCENCTVCAVSDLGLDRRLAGLFPAMDVVRQALPMVLTMLKMALVICIPLVLLIGTYDLKTVVTVS
ncbi:hypothetical protein SSTU70S_00985 [Stutzerimonas stutzeri]